MSFVLGILANLGLSQRVAKLAAPFVLAGAALVALAALYGLGTLWLHHHDRAVVAADRQASDIKAAKGQASADAHAADQRLEDVVKQKEQEKAYADAIAHPAAGDSDEPGVRLACEQLRRAGKDTAAIPACGGR